MGEEILDSIQELGRKLSGRTILHVHTSRLRGDILAGLGRLGDHFEDLGIQHRETTIVGTEDSFDVVRLTGPAKRVSDRGFGHYEVVMRENARKTFLSADLVMVHGLQPLGLIEGQRPDCPWLWRCYANLVGIAPALRSALKRYLARYQGAVFSHASFIPEWDFPCFIVPPSIDPLSPVNEPLGAAERSRILDGLDVPHDRPIALQFLGTDCESESLEAVRVWKSGRIPGNAVLVLVRIGEGPEMHVEFELDALRGLDRNVRVLRLSRDSTRELCALGGIARVVVEPTKSRWPNVDLLDVLWKSTAAVVSVHSGTAPFIRSGCGYCVKDREELSRRLGELLETPRTAKEMGAAARSMVERHHVLPRHLLNYLELILHFTGNVSRA